MAELLRELGIESTPAREGELLAILLETDSAVLETAFVCHRSGILEIASLFPFLVPDDRSSAVAQAVAYVNLALRATRLDYDIDNRRLMLRAFLVPCEEVISKGQIDFCIRAALVAAELLYLPLQDVCFRHADAAEIVVRLRDASSTAVARSRDVG